MGILDNLAAYPPELQDFFLANVTSVTVPKGTVLQAAGATASKAFFVKKGLLRSFVYDRKGRVHHCMFAPEGWLVTDVEMITDSQPALLNIDALEDSEVEVWGVEVMKGSARLPVELLVGEINILLRRIHVLQRRILMLMSETAEARYLDFLQTYPQIVQRVPLKMVASYLGITPEALSTIRKKLAQTSSTGIS